VASWIFLIAALLGAALVINAYVPRTSPLSLIPSWLAALFTTDLAFHHVGLQIVMAAGFVWAGALQTLAGQIALLVSCLSSLGLIWLWLPARRAGSVAADVAAELQLSKVAPVPRSLLAVPFRRVRHGIEVTRNAEFFRAAGRVLNLDVYRTQTGSAQRPALIYFHGGAWMFGDKSTQGLPLCHHLASLGWVCCNANHRLSPGATYPDHVVDAKAAVAWLRRNAEAYGVDASFIALAGGSSGAHIAAMAALTTDSAALQPGFESADTSVQAVVTNYGLYDLTNRLGAHHPEFFTKLVGPLVIKAFPDEEPERFRAASPRDHVASGTVPWLVIHGDSDTLAPVVEARDFVTALRAHTDAPVGYAEFPQALHGFDVWYSHRAIAAVELAARFLVTIYATAAQR